MSNIEQYAASTVEKYHIEADTESTSHRAADEVIPLIKKWGKQYLEDIKLSGAYAKNTAVSLSCDVDVLITLTPVPGKEIKNVFWNLFEYLTEQDQRVETRRVSMQVQARKMKVDLIPAYRGGGTASHILFNKKTGRGSSYRPYAACASDREFRPPAGNLRAEDLAGAQQD